MWAHDERGRPIPVDGRTLSDEDRFTEPRYDPEIHRRHVCASWLDAVRTQVGAQVWVELGGSGLRGELLAVEGDYLSLRLSSHHLALIPNAQIRAIEVGLEPDYQDRT